MVKNLVQVKMVKEILVVRFSSLGDLILTTPVFRELKKQYPDAKIHLVTSTSFASVLENNPHIDHLYALDRKGGKDAFALLVEQLGQVHFDLAFDLHYSLRSRLLMIKLFGFFYGLSSKVHSIDKRSWKRNLLLKWKINLLKDCPSQREEYLKPLAKLFPEQTLANHSELFFNEDSQTKVNTILQEINPNGKPLIGIGPSASFQGKCWPKESFLELCLALAKKGYLPLLLGGPEDLETKWIAEQAGGLVANLAGRLHFLDTVCLLQQTKLAISNDSAIVHFAEAIGTPSLALFGPTVAEFGYGPFLKNSKIIEIALPCRPCSRNGKGDCKIKETRKCLRDITAQTVLDEAEKILTGQG